MLTLRGEHDSLGGMKVETVADAKYLVKTQQVMFGDPNWIKARDILRMVNAIDGLEITCSECGGSGVSELPDDGGRWFEDDSGECSECEGSGLSMVAVDDEMDYYTLKDLISQAVSDGLLEYDDNGELKSGGDEEEAFEAI